MDTDEALFPELAMVCEGCGGDVSVPPGLSPVEAAWMHEHDCPAFVAELA
jgi:hypothetical protein